MRRATARIGQELGIGPGVPQRPLGFDRPERVEDAKFEAERPGKRDSRGELLGGLAVQPAFGISIDRPSR